MAVVISACIPANLAMKQNIRVEVFGALGGLWLHRLLEVLSSALTMIFILLIAWQFVPYAISLHENGDRTWVLGWPVWPWWSVATAMGLPRGFRAVHGAAAGSPDAFRRAGGHGRPSSPRPRPRPDPAIAKD